MPLNMSEAIGVFERAFRARNPNEIERILRENLTVQVAVIESMENAEKKINEGCYPLTIRVPYWVFKSKIKKGEELMKVYSLEEENIISEGNKKWKLQKVDSINNILPFRTYFLLKNEAGYSSEFGLTFEGNGETTRWEEIKKGEKAEKFGIGREQTWEEHAKGSYKRASSILRIYKPFLIDWAKSVFSVQNLNEKEIKETVDAIILAIKISALLHDIGKLRKEWQEAVGWKKGQPYIARTSSKCKVPFHAPYAYPFLKTFLRKIWGEYRFLDAIALATARHHSLEVRGRVEENDFSLVNGCIEFLSNFLQETFPEIQGYNWAELIEECVQETNKGSLMDEPPAPSDDFYFIYTVANRVIKFADWEDAGEEIIELLEVRGENDDT